MGELIKSFDNLNTKEYIIDISKLSSGNYILNVNDDISKKLVISR